MQPVAKRIDLLANLAIITLALILCGVLVKRYFFAVPQSVRSDEVDTSVPVGTKISLPGLAETQHERTLLLALSKGCHFCAESAPFYQRLLRVAAGQANLKVIAVLPQEVGESRNYLQELSLSIADVRRAPLGSIGVKGTPTLLLLDASGTVTQSWVGKLTADAEGSVLNAIQLGAGDSPQAADFPTTIKADALNQLVAKGDHVFVVDVRERAEFQQGHIPGARNIPFDELAVRAPNELSTAEQIVTYADCARCANDEKSLAAQQVLRSLNFSKAAALDGGLQAWRQAGLPVTQ